MSACYRIADAEIPHRIAIVRDLKRRVAPDDPSPDQLDAVLPPVDCARERETRGDRRHRPQPRRARHYVRER